jgi:hypothetical protein
MTVVTDDLTADRPVDAARAYAHRGWRVVPIAPNTKHPAHLKAWSEAATTDPELIGEWWQRWPADGVGVATGQRSGVWVLDVDPGHGGDDSLADLEAEHGALPATMEVITGSGGRHLYFAWPEGATIRNDQAGRLGPGLDVRGDGGQVVAPPTVHPNGRRYEWELSSPLAPAPAPGWLVALLTATGTEEPRRDHIPYTGPSRPGDRWAEQVTWAELLEADGATFVGRRVDHRTGHPYELWCRPGKDPREGASATLYYGGTDVLKIHSSAWPGLAEGQTFTRWGYHVQTRHGGDHAAAARAVQRAEDARMVPDTATTSPNGASGPPVADLAAPAPERFIDWAEFWGREWAEAEWIVEPVLAKGRGHAIYAKAKQGKSLVSLYLAATKARADTETVVVYLDYEMSAADLYERLDAMGFGPDADLSRLRYWLYPDLPALNTPAGGAALDAVLADVEADHPGAHLVLVIDTFSRAVTGEENSNDTANSFFAWCGILLKRRGVTWVRLDHAGKDEARGQVGGSAKSRDVDVVWNLTRTEGGGITLKRDFARMPWVPETAVYAIHEEPALRFTLVGGGGWPEGTSECADDLDELGLPLEVSTRVAATALRTAAKGRRMEVIRAGIKYRKERFGRNIMPVDGGGGSVDNPSGTHLGTHPDPLSGETRDPLPDPPTKSASDLRDPPPDPPGPTPNGVGGPEGPPPLGGAPFPAGPDPTEVLKWF